MPTANDRRSRYMKLSLKEQEMVDAICERRYEDALALRNILSARDTFNVGRVRAFLEQDGINLDGLDRVSRRALAESDEPGGMDYRYS